MEFVDALLSTLTYLVSSFILFAIGILAYRFFHKKIGIQHELVERDNLAFSFAYIGYFVGLVMVVGGALIGESKGIWVDVINMFIYGILGVILLNLAIKINDIVILNRFKIYDEIISQKNIGTGIIEGANAIATGLILMGSIYGEGGGIVTAIVFWIVGQLLMILTSYIYNLITPYDVHEYIEKNNVAVGIGFAGAFIAIGNLIRQGLMVDFESWVITAENVGFDVALGFIFLPIARLVTDKLILPGQNLTNELINQQKPNIGAAVVEAFAYIAGSVLISWSV
ncbi:MAG: DUF350 domain-containing protein [Bacteroidota bacterium]